MNECDTVAPSSTGCGPATRGLLGRFSVRVVLVAWITVVLFVFCLQEGLYKYAGNGAVGQCLRDLNGWVGRSLSFPTTFEPEP